MHKGKCRSAVALAFGCILLAGCDGGDGSDGSDASALPTLVAVETYAPETGVLSHVMRVSYGDGVAVLRPYDAAGAPLGGNYSQECVFAPTTPAPVYPALTQRYFANTLRASPTGQIMLGISGLPDLPVIGCQDYFPEHPLQRETLNTAALANEGKVGDRTEVARGNDGRLTQRRSGELVAGIVGGSGFSDYAENLRYVSDGERTTGLIYGLKSWPAGAVIYSGPGNIIIDLVLLETLGTLLQTDEGLYVFDGFAERYEYDNQGLLAGIRRYDGRGDDGLWLTGDDEPAAGGYTRYGYVGTLLERIESGLDPASAAPAESYRLQRFIHADGALREKRVYDAQSRLLEVWTYGQ